MTASRRIAILFASVALLGSSPAACTPSVLGGQAAIASPTPSAARSCEEQVERNRRRGRLIGGLAGGAAGLIFGRRGNTAPLVAALVPTGALLGDAIAGLLDCDERRKAATATEDAIRGGVGTTTSWASETRPGVTGTSTVTAVAAADGADGSDCMSVTDVVIVDGQETRASKRMCRRPPANRYVRV
jgi:surface antigen